MRRMTFGPGEWKTTAAIASVAMLTMAIAPGKSAAEDDEVTIAHGISAFGELKYPSDFTHFDYVNPDAPKGGRISFRGFLASQTFDSLNKFILDGEPAQGLERVYDTLLARAWDEPDAVYGRLAETIEYPADRSWVIFNIRPQARFADGHPVTAEDVAFTIKTLRTDGLPTYRIQLSDVETVAVLDEHRVRVDFAEESNTRDLISTVGLLEILPAHYYSEVQFTRSTLEAPLGSGPYLVADADPGRSVTYCLNEDYWGADLPVNRGAWNFDCVVYEYFADNTAAFEALKSGEYLFHEEFFSALWATAYDFPALERGWVVREVIPDGRSSGAQGFWFNTRRPNLQDWRVRKALGLMFNFEWSNETLFYGLYERTDSFWENSSMQATGVPQGSELALLEEFRDQLPASVFNAPAYTPPVNALRRTDRNALATAGALLDEAGWTISGGRFRTNAAGVILTVEFVDDNPAFERIILPYIDNLVRLGVDARIVQVDSAQMQQRQEDFDFDVMTARLALPSTPSVELRTVFGSAGATAPGTLNLSGIADPVVDALIERVIGAEDRQEMEVAVRALDRVLRDRHIWSPQWFKGTHWIAYWDVFGRPSTKPAYRRGDEFWWWDEEKYESLQTAGALR